MKTALQEYIYYLEGIAERDNIPSWVVTTAKNYLPIEKQNLIDVAIEFGNHGKEMMQERGEEYYNTVFK